MPSSPSSPRRLPMCATAFAGWRSGFRPTSSFDRTRMDRGEADMVAGSLFGGYSAVIGAQLTDQTEMVSLAAGEWLFREGDRADHAYVVHSGRVEIVAEHPS